MPRMSEPMALLAQQHDHIIALLDRFVAAPEAERPQLATELAEILADHLAVEQSLVYPILGGSIPPSVRDELLAEHAQIKRALAELLWIGVDDAEAAARTATLRDLLCGHAAYQEQELFELAGSLDPIDRTVLDKRLHAWFASSVASAA